MMRTRRSVAVAIALLAFLASAAQDSAAPAAQLLQKATAAAARSHKNVLVVFGASWCVWCRKMDSSINDPKCKDYFNNNYVILHLTVLESANKKKLENPGAVEMLNKHMPVDQGLPFWMVMDKNGNVLADSNYKPGENSGCPARPEEVDYLLTVLKQTSSLSENMAETVRKRFLQNND